MGRISGVSIHADPKDLERIIAAFRKVEHISEEAVISKAVNATLKEAQRVLSNRAKASYSGEASAGIKGRSQTTNAKASASEPEGELLFRSEQHAITKFKFTPKSTPTRFLEDTVKRFRVLDFKSQIRPDGTKIGVRVGRQKKYAVHAGQLKGQRGKLFHDVFVVKFKSGHIALAQREGASRYPINQILGSSDMMMTKSRRVFGEERDNIAKFYSEQCAKSLQKALEKAGKA